jgi:hypothetical protein
MAGKIPKPDEVDHENIKRPTFEQFSAEDQKDNEEIRKKIKEEHEQEIQRKEDEATKHYMSHFSVDSKERSQSSRKANYSLKRRSTSAFGCFAPADIQSLAASLISSTRLLADLTWSSKIRLFLSPPQSPNDQYGQRTGSLSLCT